MKAKEVAMVIAIALLSALFVGLLVDAVYESPEYDDYCDHKERIAKPHRFAEGECTANYTVEAREQMDQCYEDGGFPEYTFDENRCETGFKSCNMCGVEYDDASEIYNRNLFFIIAPIALLAIIFGLYLGAEVIGTGMMFSGILLLIYCTSRYFSDMSKILRVVVIGIELVLLLWISKKKLKK